MAADPTPETAPTIRYGFLWVTAIVILGGILANGILGWVEYVTRQQMQGQAPALAAYARDAFGSLVQNWQSEFMFVAWQIAGLGIVYPWVRLNRAKVTRAGTGNPM